MLTRKKRHQKKEETTKKAKEFLRIYPNPQNITRRLVESNQIPQNMRPYPPDFKPLYQTRKSRSIFTLPSKSILGELQNTPFPRPYPPQMTFPINEIISQKEEPLPMTVIQFTPRPPSKEKRNRSIKTLRLNENIRNKKQKSIAKNLKNSFEKKKKTYKMSQSQKNFTSVKK